MSCDIAVDNDLRKRIYWNVTKFLGGQWQDLSSSELQVKPLTGGLSNYLYTCSLPNDKVPRDGEPKCVLIRIFGEFLKDEALVVDCMIFALLAEKGLGPRLYGVFPGGRIEEFIPSVALTLNDLRQPSVSKHIARIIANFHALDMPVSRNPNRIFKLIQRFAEDAKTLSPTVSIDHETLYQLHKFVENMQIAEEMEWLKRTLLKVNSPVVFCHNDIQAGNLLKFCTNGNAYELKMIDFEFAGYGYRGYDIANHFCEWTFDNFYSEAPYYKHYADKYPSRQEQLAFFSAYRDHCDTSLHESMSDERLLQEVSYFTLMSHLMWATWSAAQVKVTSITFDYMSYAMCRMELYRSLKADLINQTIQQFD